MECVGQRFFSDHMLASLRGSYNKTRAAAYLGWDPDTLVTRMTECGLLEATPPPNAPVRSDEKSS